MARAGKHKAKYDRYKNSGHKQENKRLRAERNEDRIAHFAQRAEEGKCYVYSKESSDKKWKDFIKGKSADYVQKHLEELRKQCFGSNIGSRKTTRTATLTSLFGKLDNKIEKGKAERAKAKRNPKRRSKEENI